MEPSAEQSAINTIGERLKDYYTQDEAAMWMSLPHPQLEGVTPSDAIKSGRASDVLAIIRRLDEAAYL